MAMKRSTKKSAPKRASDPYKGREKKEPAAYERTEKKPARRSRPKKK